MLFGSTVLEVIIGMIFVYLLLSLLCSAVGEYIEARLNNRAKLLQDGIRLLLNETSGEGADLAKQLYEHGLIRPLYREKNKLPSYIPARTFALALWNMATTVAAAEQASSGGNTPAAAPGITTDLKKIREAIANHLPNEELRTAMLTLIDEAEGDIERARKNVEDWYNGMMDRVSGWYKRRSAVILLVLGFIVAAAINADTITIAKSLVRDGALRDSIVAAAEQRLATPPTPSPAPGGSTPADRAAREQAAQENLRQAYADVNALGLPIGWTRQNFRIDARGIPTSGDFFWSWAGWQWLVLKLFGVLLTGFAISQGAPFWFDLLNKFMVIRSTVKPAEKSQEQPSKDKPAPRTEIERRPDNDAEEGNPKG